jgi:hypothetical protein
VHLLAISRETPQTFGQGKRLAVHLTLKATYSQIGMFLDDLERGDGFMRVEQLEIDASTKESPDEPMRVSLVVSTIYMAPIVKPVQ